VKRYLALVLLLFIIFGLVLGGNRLLGRALDATLPALLTSELGLPVTIEPIEARVLSLTATTPRLLMGAADKPAVIAANASVSLDWTDLLRGEIRLVEASASDLTLELSNWPTNDNPWPTDYMFLDPWLPSSLSLEEGRYIDPEGGNYPVSNAVWRRGPGGASITWRENRLGGEVQLAATLDSLFGLLRLEPIKVDLAISKPGQKDADIDLKGQFSPGAGGGYQLTVDIHAPGANARIEAGNDVPWRLPGFSRTQVEELRVERLLSLADAYRLDEHLRDDEVSLHTPLPALSLPGHQGEVSINEIWYRDELGKETAFTFHSGPTGLLISDLTSQGPRGTLTGRFALESDAEGWKVNLDARMQARETDKTLAPEYLDADWIWQQGHARLTGQGARWQDLLGSLDGAVELRGYHLGEVRTPISVTAGFDKTTEDFTLQGLEITLGNGRISGDATVIQKHRPLLKLRLRGEDLELDFLFDEHSEIRGPGVKIPEYLGFFPGIDIDGKIAISRFSAPAVKLATANIDLRRSPENGILRVDAKGANNGDLKLELLVRSAAGDSRTVSLISDLEEIDLAELFQQEVNLHSRSTGRVALSGTGEGLATIFNAMQGTARLSTEFRRDDNWQRASTDEEKLDVAGNARLIIDGVRIMGIQLDNLDIDSIDQDVSGRLAMRVDRVPWLTAEFEARKLDVDGLLALLPETAAEADRTDLLSFLQKLDPARLSLDADSVRWSEQALSDLSLRVSSGKDSFNIEQLDFRYEGSPLESSGGLTWKGSKATLEATARIRDFELDRFLLPGGSSASVPVSGSADIQSQGESFATLLANVTGHVSLTDNLSGPEVDETLRRRVEIDARRVEEGIQGQVKQFQWGRNSLQGSFRYREGNRPYFEFQIDSGTLHLETPEEGLDAQKPVKKEEGGSLLAATARTSANLVSEILRSPARLFSGPGEADPGKKLFNDKPLPFDALQGYDAQVKGKLTRVVSRAGVFDSLNLDAGIQSGQLKLDARADNFNGGPGDLLLVLDTGQSPSTIELSGNFHNIQRADGKPTYPRSGFFSVNSRGSTSAEIAANLNGQLYLEFGKGPFDYVNFSMFTADMATQIATALVPGVDKKQPQLECGVVLGVFEDGVGKTPVGYTLRTDKANLLGRMTIDLRKEQVELALDSRSREGVGLAVGNVFSNTIRVKGPLTDPQIVPHTTGIIWRGWAAFMTAGLSVVGESVLKRAMAAENPCKSIKQDIRKLACGTEQPIASSPLVCG
jgi:hypothetical protein